MASWKADTTKLMIDYYVNPKCWFKVMQNNAVFHKHQPNKRNEDNPPPLKTEKGEIGDITLLITFHFNEDVLYQEYTSNPSKEKGNEKVGR